MAAQNSVDIKDALRSALSTITELAPGEITDDFNVGDLGLDSLDLTELIFDVEDRLGVQISADLMDQIFDLEGGLTFGRIQISVEAWYRGISSPIGQEL